MLSDLTGGEMILLAICIALVFAPPKYDPAIRWKEFNIEWAKRIADRKHRK